MRSLEKGLPQTTLEMHQRLGLDGRRLKTLAEVRRAQQQISEWAVEAAVQRWPGLLHKTEGEALAAVYSNARAKWKHFDSLCKSLDDAERAVLLSMEPTA